MDQEQALIHSALRDLSIREQALIPRRPRRTVVAPTTPTATVIRPHFITPFAFVTSGAIVPWTTFDASSLIPNASVAVILEGEFSLFGPDSGDVFTHVWIRRDATSPSYLLLRGQSSGANDANSGSNQAMFPVTASRRFDYTVEAPGFNNELILRVIGYWK